MRIQLILGAVMVALLSACHTRTTANSQSAYDSLAVEIDSIGVSMTLKVDYPTTDTLLCRALAQWVGECVFDTEDETARVQPPAYGGDLSAFLQACAEQRWRQLETDTYEGFPDTIGESEEEGITAEAMRQMATEEEAALSSCRMTFRIVSENDSLLTWNYDYDFYVYNTAHPSHGNKSITLRKTIAPHE